MYLYLEYYCTTITLKNRQRVAVCIAQGELGDHIESGYPADLSDWSSSYRNQQHTSWITCYVCRKHWKFKVVQNGNTSNSSEKISYLKMMYIYRSAVCLRAYISFGMWELSNDHLPDPYTSFTWAAHYGTTVRMWRLCLSVFSPSSNSSHLESLHLKYLVGFFLIWCCCSSEARSGSSSSWWSQIRLRTSGLIWVQCCCSTRW